MSYIVHGFDQDGDELFYTGKAGAGIADSRIQKARLFDSKEFAEQTAAQLTRRLNEGVEFKAQQINDE